MSLPCVAVLLTKSMWHRCVSPADANRIAAAVDLRLPNDDAFDTAAQRLRMAGSDAIITGWGTHALDDAMLEAAPRLRAMFHSAGSVKHLLPASFQKRGIVVTSAAAALAHGVAEFAFGMMLVTMKSAWRYRESTRRGMWDHAAALSHVREPYRAVVGIIGMSHVGRQMIRLCQSLELESILLFDPYVSHEAARALGVEKVELDELMRRSDVVSLHAPAVESARHMINARNLALLKDGALFINTARGMCVDEPALIAELRTGRITACIDVTDSEPPAPDSPLRSLENCILTPHIAGAIKENTYRQGALIADEIEAFASGNPPLHPVDLSRLDQIA